MNRLFKKKKMKPIEHNVRYSGTITNMKVEDLKTGHVRFMSKKKPCIND